MGNKKIVCARVLGGLGNQLFIYAFARAFTLKNNHKLIFDVKTGFVNDTYGRSPKLDKYVLEFPIASKFFTYLFYLTKLFPSLSKHIFKTQKINEPNSRSFFEISDESIKNIKIIFIEGYFQSYKYMIEYECQIKNDINFQFPKTQLIRQIEANINSNTSVSIHVRRMQYENVLDLDYYLRAIALIKSKIAMPSFYIFSDDIDWCKSNFSESESLTFIRHDVADEVADLWLMTLCKHHIIANSSFSWWGAWLSKNEEKIVIAPGKTDIGVYGCLYPDKWITIDN
jgi:hypothetical protein